MVGNDKAGCDVGSGGRLLLTEIEAARRLNLSPRSLYTLRKSGQIAYVAFGKSGVRYLPDELDRWIKSATRTDAV